MLAAVAQSQDNPPPRIYRIDALTDTVTGNLATPNTWPRAVALQRYQD